ncbi:4-hydroxythreonine-4-phosphate dehydrogenase PdxA [Candidatus Nitronereus thalassa]|uniref:4-hydroxythreonine-4-phosphate dehydrogenase PdxA n=1 Tax=Candidatus Nitronereus thalassa TaxID=3020898 RepID=A0ABU3K9H8_9BACT|nr:4-hydroxythreonine-4-phosphate dehydrogenase PdxA [Candidatus Nitronereus thalassa]MDT7043070.1 4-hydroxythreonine-4-phosphate dehydrogenase PdxA [Candidatus Nitronereus thalassa]
MPISPTRSKPFLAITMGDPAGIGPEIILKALASPMVWRECRPIVVGSVPVFKKEMERLGSSLKIVSFSGAHISNNQKLVVKGRLPILDSLKKPLGRFPMGKARRETGAASLQCIDTAVHLAQSQCVAGIVTAPINKEAIHLAGCTHPGHTELLAALTKTKNFGMMLMGGPLKILFVTTHLSIRTMPAALTTKGIFNAIQLAHRAMRQHFQIARPRVGVAALNPHAGEHGLFGNEEQRIIAPTILKAKHAGMRVSGPWPADTLFGAAVRGDYDVVVAMYHDQGLIPLKTIAFGQCINMTVGLPILRTSVDHGTAYDIAGKGKADPLSLIQAITLAARLARPL